MSFMLEAKRAICSIKVLFEPQVHLNRETGEEAIIVVDI